MLLCAGLQVTVLFTRISLMNLHIKFPLSLNPSRCPKVEKAQQISSVLLESIAHNPPCCAFSALRPLAIYETLTLNPLILNAALDPHKQQRENISMLLFFFSFFSSNSTGSHKHLSGAPPPTPPPPLCLLVAACGLTMAPSDSQG